MLFGILLATMVVLMWIVTRILFKFLRGVLRKVSAFFSGSSKAA